MGGLVIGVLSGGALSLAAMLFLGVLHRYALGPALAPFGDPALFTEMSAWGLVVLILIRLVSAWLGSLLAVRLSDEPHAAWTGPAVIVLCALATVLMGMSQPLWSLILTLVLVLGLGWAIGRAHVGLPILPGRSGEADAGL